MGARHCIAGLRRWKHWASSCHHGGPEWEYGPGLRGIPDERAADTGVLGVGYMLSGAEVVYPAVAARKLAGDARGQLIAGGEINRGFVGVAVELRGVGAPHVAAECITRVVRELAQRPGNRIVAEVGGLRTLQYFHAVEIEEVGLGSPGAAMVDIVDEGSNRLLEARIVA